MAPDFRPVSSSGEGPRTLNRMSASFSAAAALGATWAPASMNSWSEMEAVSPAPASTTTSKPEPFSRFTDSGVAATRVSPGRRSRVTAIRVAMRHIPKTDRYRAPESVRRGPRGQFLGKASAQG